MNAGALIQGVRFLTTGERSSPEAIAAVESRTRALLLRARELGLAPERPLEGETRARLSRERSYRQWFVPGSS